MKLKVIFCALLISVISVLPFYRSLESELLNLDDRLYVTNNSVKEGLTTENALWALTSLDDAIWMPLTRISYMLDFWGPKSEEKDTISEDAVRRLHVHSIVIHGCNAGILFVLLFSILLAQHTPAAGSPLKLLLVSAIASLFWAVHPLRCESVCWVASRKDVYSLLFILISLLGWVKFRITQKWSWYLFSLGAVVLSAAAKPSVIVYPGLIFLIDALIFSPETIVKSIRKISLAIGSGKFQEIRNHDQSWEPWTLLPPLALALGFAKFGYWVQLHSGAANDLSDVPAWYNVLNAFVSIGVYLKNTFYPFDLSVECIHRYPALPRFFWFGLLISALVGLFLFRRSKTLWDGCAKGSGLPTNPYFLVGMLWFLGALFPFLGFLKFGMHAYADRFTYIPSIGISLVLVGLSIKYMNRFRPLLIFGLVLTSIFAAATVRQCGFWKDDRIAFTHSLELDGEENYVAHLVLGQYYFEHGHDLKKCLEHFGKVYDKDPPKGIAVAGFIYMMALEESGEIERSRTFLSKMQKWSLETVDQILGPTGGDASSRPRMSTYTMSRISAFTLDATLRPVAEEELERLLKDKPNDRDFLYLEYRLRLAQGDQERANVLKERIKTSATGGSGYLRYSFL